MESRWKPPKKERWKENKWQRGQKEAFRSQLRVMASDVSQPLGPIYVRMSRVAGDAFNTAARDDTDPMRQTDRQTDRRTDSEARRGGREALCRKLRQTTYGLLPPPPPPSPPPPPPPPPSSSMTPCRCEGGGAGEGGGRERGARA